MSSIYANTPLSRLANALLEIEDLNVRFISRNLDSATYGVKITAEYEKAELAARDLSLTKNSPVYGPAIDALVSASVRIGISDFMQAKIAEAQSQIDNPFDEEELPGGCMGDTDDGGEVIH